MFVREPLPTEHPFPRPDTPSSTRKPVLALCKWCSLPRQLEAGVSIGDKHHRTARTPDAPFLLPADDVSSRSDAGRAVLRVDEVRGHSGVEHAECKAPSIFHRRRPRALPFVCNQTVGVPSRRTSQQFHAGERHSHRACPWQRRHDICEQRKRDPDEIALRLKSVDHRNGHFLVQVVEDIEAGEAGESGQGHVRVHKYHPRFED